MAKPEPKRISALDTADPLTGVENIALTQNERTVRGTMQQVKTFADTSCECTLVSRYTDSCTTAVTFEEYLATYTLPANTLQTAGSYLDVYAYIVFEATATTKGVTFYFGGTAITLASAVYNDLAAILRLRIQRDTQTTQRITGHWELSASGGGVGTQQNSTVFALPTENLATDTTLSISGTNGTANAEDICLGSWIVDLHKLDANS